MDKVEFGPSKLPGYEAGPKGAPAVVVLQEWWAPPPAGPQAPGNAKALEPRSSQGLDRWRAKP
jgi:hypothetical protein